MMAELISHTTSQSPQAQLFGRDRERATLRDALTAALAGRGALVLIDGEAGIGKTALAEALLTEAAERGALLLTGRCYDLTDTPPYGPWSDALTRRPPDIDPAPAVTTALPLNHEGNAAGSQRAIFAGVWAYLKAQTSQQPVVLLLEDLHWADPASLDLLRVVGRDLGGAALLLIATYRSDEINRQHPLYQLLPPLIREARAIRITLPRLELADLRRLLHRYSLAEDDALRLARYLSTRANGNPFFTGELLRALEEDRTLSISATGWSLADLTALPLPPLLRQVLDARLDRLGEETRDLLACAAVIGEVIPFDLWQTVSGVDEVVLLDVVERARAARLLVEIPGGQAVRFVHALVRDVLYEGLPVLRRWQLHRRAGEALMMLPRPDPDAVASHFQGASDARAVDWLVRAGERARGAYAWLSAAARFETALVLLARAGTDPARRALLLMHLAHLRRYSSPELGFGYLEEAEQLAIAAGDEILAAGARFDRGHLRGMTHDRPRGIAEMASAMPTLEGLTPEDLDRLPVLESLAIAPAERAHFHRGVFLLHLAHSGRYAEIRALGAGVTALGQSHRGHLGLGVMHAALGQPDRARAAFAAAVAGFRAAGQYREISTALLLQLWALTLPYQADQPAERQRLVAEATEAEARADGVADVPPRVVGLPVLSLEGRWAEADRATRAALAHGREDTLYTWCAATFGGTLAGSRGDAVVAWDAVRLLLPDGSATAPGEMTYLVALPMQRLAAKLALDTGDLSTARVWLEAHDRWLAESGQLHGLAEGQIAWATYHRVAGAADAAQHTAEQALATARAPRQPLALLAARRLLGELALEAGRLADAETHLVEALALARVCDAPYERALTLLALAEARAADDRDAARAALGEARAILSRLGPNAALPRAVALSARLAMSLPRPGPYPVGLSAREVEVLRLVAQGLTSPQIAAQLSRSVRTIDQHLRSIYNKIGVSSRAAAAAFAVEHRLR